MILAIETATNVCSVVFLDDNGQFHEKRTERRGSHSEQLFEFIEELQEAHNFSVNTLDAILISEGPGSYTGLRISASAVKGLLFQTEVPLYAINTLASYARKAGEEYPQAQTIHSIIDARRVHVYHQRFEWQGSTLTTDDQVEVIPIEAFESAVRQDDIIIGTGLKRINQSVREKAVVMGSEFITAGSLIRLFEDENINFYRKVDPASYDPRYYTSNQVK